MKIFISNLPFNYTREHIQPILEKYGEVHFLQIVTGPDGKSKGIAFADIDEHKPDGVKQLNSVRLNGRVLRVSEAVKQPQTNG